MTDNTSRRPLRLMGSLSTGLRSGEIMLLASTTDPKASLSGEFYRLVRKGLLERQERKARLLDEVCCKHWYIPSRDYTC